MSHADETACSIPQEGCRDSTGPHQAGHIHRAEGKGREGKGEDSWAPPVDLDGPVNETPYRSAPTLSPEGDASSVRHQTLCTQGNMGTW